MEKTGLVVIDLQEKLAPTIQRIDKVILNSKALIKAARLYGIPIILAEQKKLGNTIEEIQKELDFKESIPKTHFSCYKEEKFKQELESKDIETVILCGIEAHICVTQTALDLAEEGYEVYLPIDATSSHHHTDHEATKKRVMNRENICLGSTEMLLYELAEDAADKKFKQLLKIVKERRKELGLS